MGRVKELRTEQVEAVTDVVCDACGKTCNKLPSTYKATAFSAEYEYATLEADFGYFSDHRDGDYVQCILCQTCFEKIEKFIKNELGGIVPCKNRYKYLDQTLDTLPKQNI